MSRHMSEPVKTFSVGFAEAGSENELDDARRVAEFVGTEHHELELSFAENASRARGARLAPRRAACRSVGARLPRLSASSPRVT